MHLLVEQSTVSGSRISNNSDLYSATPKPPPERELDIVIPVIADESTHLLHEKTKFIQ